MKARRRGFTLAELAVMMVIFGIFTTALAAVMKLSLSYWGRTTNFVLAEQNARVAMSTITTEFRQSMHPSTNPVDILVPTADAPASGSVANQLVFLEAVPGFNPLVAGFNLDDPSNYQQINYFVAGNAIKREIMTFNSSGGVVTDTTQTLVAADSRGTLSLTVTRVAENSATINIVSQEGTFNYVLNTSNVTAVMH